MMLAKTSTVDAVTTEFYTETPDGPAVRYVKTCAECGMSEDFTRGVGWSDFDVFARHSRFAGLHYRLHTRYPAGPDSFGTTAVL
jgi:hypothetical protein